MSPAAGISGEHYDRVFDGEDLDGVVVEGARYADCVFRRCSLAGAKLTRCAFLGTTFEGCDLSVLSVIDCTFANVIVTNTKAIGIDWTRVRWPRVPIGEPLEFRESVLDHSTFLGLSLPGIPVLDGSARECDFREAKLNGADFSGTDLTGSLFGGTDLRGADLSRARNYHIPPAENLLTGAKFSFPEALALLTALDIEIVE